MEFRHLRHFVAVAEELHFGRAAERLGMAQPPLSQSIRRLEASLELQLLERSRRHVVLTPAGRVLLDEARRILNQVELAERLTRRAAASGVRRLRIGFTPIVMFTVLPRALREFRIRWPGVEVLLEERPSLPQIEALLAGSQDLGILFKPGESVEGLAMRVIEHVRTVVAVPADHPLAQRSSIRLAELAGEPFVSLDPNVNPESYATFNAVCRAAGFVPNVVQHANQTHTILSLVAHGVGVSLVGENAARIRFEGVALVPLDGHPDELYQEIMLAWVPAASSPALRSFVNLFDEIGAER